MRPRLPLIFALFCVNHGQVMQSARFGRRTSLARRLECPNGPFEVGFGCIQASGSGADYGKAVRDQPFTIGSSPVLAAFAKLPSSKAIASCSRP